MQTEKSSITNRNAEKYDARAREWQAAMDSNVGHKYLEKPAMEGQVPQDLTGKDVLCIGVGSGDELTEILKRCPRRVVGIDVSVKLLDIAKARFPGVEFQQMDMTALLFPDKSFDFIYSSLTFHYARDWDLLLSEVHRVLKESGGLLFSTHHPMYWGRKAPTGNTCTNQRGITLTEYNAILPADIEITYYNHASDNAICEAVEHAGFETRQSFIPSVIDTPLSEIPPNDIAAYQKLKRKNEEMPLFFIVSAAKK